MAGTKAGGQKAAAAMRKKYGNDFYARIGRKGGKMSGPRGGFSDRAFAAKAGAMSKRGKAKSNA